MGIELDWQVEATDGHEQVGEDEAVVVARQRRLRRWRRVLIVLGVILALAGIVGGVRYTQVREARREMLIATVESEALALRIGDLDAFMRRQSDDEIWQGRQIRLFREFQSLAPSVQIPGDIRALRMVGDEAQVTVRELVDGEPAEGVWIYQYTERGWRHIDSWQEPWSQNRARVVEGFVFSYKRANQPLVDDLDRVLVRWRDETLSLFGGGDLPTLQVWIEDRTGAANWLNSEQRILVIPGSGADGTPLTDVDASLRARLAELLARRWNEALVEELDIPAYHRWIEVEIGMLLRHRFDRNAPPAPMLDPLTHAFGPDLMPELIGQLRERPIAADALPLAMSAAAPRDLSPEQLVIYLAHMLDAEMGLRHHQPEQASPANRIVRAIFTDGTALSDSSRMFEPDVLSFAPATRYEVHIAHDFGDELWVVVEGVWQEPLGTGEMITVDVRGMAPFRQVNGYWVRADRLTEDDWGAAREERGDLLTLRYTQLDLPYVGDSLPELEAAYRQAAADFGVAEPPALTLEVSGARSTPFLIHPDSDALDIALQVRSPHLASCVPAQELRACFLVQAKEKLVWRTLGLALGRMPDDPSGMYYPRTPMELAVSSWELARLEPVTRNWASELFPWTEIEGVQLSPLEDVWISSGSWNSPDDWFLKQLQVRALLDVLVEQYGIEALPLLVQHLDSADSLYGWLYDSLGVTPEEIEFRWRARVLELLEAYGVTVTAGVINTP